MACFKARPDARFSPLNSLTVAIIINTSAHHRRIRVKRLINKNALPLLPFLRSCGILLIETREGNDSESH